MLVSSSRTRGAAGCVLALPGAPHLLPVRDFGSGENLTVINKVMSLG